MSNSQHHIIQKVFLEVNAPNLTVAQEFKNSLDVFLKNRVFPQLEKELNALAIDMPSTIVQISRVYLEIEEDFTNDLKKLGGIMTEKVVAKIRKKANSAQNEEQVVFLETSESHMQAFLYFLTNGTRTWYAPSEPEFFTEAMIQQIRKTEGFKSVFKEKLKNEVVIERFLNQFDSKTVLLLLKTVYQNDEVLQILENCLATHVSSTHLEKKYWKAIISYLIKEDLPPLSKLFHGTKSTKRRQGDVEPRTIWQKALLKIGDHLRLGAAIRKDENTTSNIDGKFEVNTALKKLKEESSEVNPPEESSYYIENAGLVVLHPFLKHFFENCDLLDSDEKLKDSELAVHLLHYLATKKEQQWEHQMVFEKFLCGLPITQSISRHVIIPDVLKEESENLLKSVLDQWEVLKNASPGLLRNEFLQRKGKLILKGKNPKLIIERKTQDILMNKLPWTIGICKLPWHKELLFTDW